MLAGGGPFEDLPASSGADGTPSWSSAAKSRLPFTWRAIVASAVKLFGPVIAHPSTQPSAYPTSTRPYLSTVTSMKSSRLRVPLPQPPKPPPQIVPRWTGSFGVASTVVHVLPPSNVSATYRCHMPGQFGSSPIAPEPVYGVPRNANAARPGSPATTAGNAECAMLNGTPTSRMFDHVLPWSCETATFGWPSPSS